MGELTEVKQVEKLIEIIASPKVMQRIQNPITTPL
jgi:hypothetical protein